VACEQSKDILHGYLDNELDAARAAEFERHLESCRECTGALENAEALRAGLRRAALYEPAPANLRSKIAAELGSASAVAPTAIPLKAQKSASPWRWLAVAATVLVIAGAGWLASRSFSASSGAADLAAADLIDAHVRSLQPGHLMDVVSTDQHTVKPWFDGKVDFIPPVNDFSDEGFPLAGGRLDAFRGRTVAALIYSRHKHVINLFVWPEQAAEKNALQPRGSRQGYNWIEWRHGDMEFCAVSDLNAQELADFEQLVDRQ
jgi:mycothiol system anti-sigma-R factor